MPPSAVSTSMRCLAVSPSLLSLPLLLSSQIAQRTGCLPLVTCRLPCHRRALASLMPRSILSTNARFAISPHLASPHFLHHYVVRPQPVGRCRCRKSSHTIVVRLFLGRVRRVG
ncbi:hypothetical protein BRADI_3g26675v3 [Brachypodium distachyon]|uniref:Uncharacterized protein n=1 Tax=Brachypodium distachyon TaxID=15368 RepID=A0A2K2CZC2_BRADI|nr:hypothetical protein BRADI_3g26675v3 [Brachypodium distachyon]